MACLKLRDRDAIVTKENLIFRVFGYAHPLDAYVCDIKYAPSIIFQSDNPKALRNKGGRIFYKFYEAEGWEFLQRHFPQYLILHEILQRNVVGVNQSDIAEIRKPEGELAKLLAKKPQDELAAATHDVLRIISQHSGLPPKNFGVFGSMLHGFHHPQFSDIDLVVYGRRNIIKQCETLQELYSTRDSLLTNEFATDDSIRGKHWRFVNYSAEEFLWHQQRKMIYALFNDRNSGRIIKTEFEPVKDWTEISNEYDPKARIIQKGWTKMTARVTNDEDVAFIPSVYGIAPLEILDGPKASGDVRRLVSYMEEFRLQAQKNEEIYVEGNLEEVITSKDSFYQVTLTYCPLYYEQVLKSLEM